ncbi:hypothetical protein PR202_gb27216 [Eleusine coracana subsp. coracana]|uniref:Cytochrome P450 n=1 Tax=Eleusine coracana subsp. coracana TaxID=191504 RepID=A0AAV5FTY0_ELECO|nr:hypothetical protein PR202_gb27216 [Eleusine coracana subsp. coracana]
MAAAVLSFIVALLLSVVAWSWKRRRSGSNNSNNDGLLPPSPRRLPVVGHLHLLGSLPHRGLRSIAASHGPVLLLRLGRAPTVVVSSASGTEEVMRARDLAFASRPASAMADRLMYHLLSARRTLSFRRVREQEAEKLVAQIRRRCCCSDSEPMDLVELLVGYANNVVSRAAFGDESSRGLYEEDDDADRGRRVREVLNEFQKLLATQPVGEILPWLGCWVDAVTGLDRRVRRTFQALDALLDKVIEDHRHRQSRRDFVEEDDRRDFVDVLLDVSRNEKEYGVRLGTNEIKAIILVSTTPYLLLFSRLGSSLLSNENYSINKDMFAAGSDTTSTAMEWAMAELVTHPRAMRRIQHEIRQAAVGEKHIDDKLPCLNAVIKETLRLHPPIPLLVPRQTLEDTELLGYRVPAGTRVVVNAWAIGRDPATWGRDADEFVPDRFLLLGNNNGSTAAAEVDVDYKGQSFELIPFGAGRRGCPGVGFAEQTVQTGLATLLYHFDWDPAPLDMTEMNGLTVHIKAGLHLRAKPWIPPSAPN